MTIVVKIGGAALEDPVILRKCARAIAELAQDGHRVAVVHGGGSALTRVLKQLGKQSEFVNGLRITDAEQLVEHHIGTIFRGDRRAAGGERSRTP